jgi:anti-sigma factor RsiW
VSKLDRHLTTEELSALLDNQLAQDEAGADYRDHLASCQQCQQELADLKQTVRLLHALPPPPLPRSFVLPAGIAQPAPESTEAQNEPNIHILRSTNNSPRRARTRTSAGRRIFSLVGTLAAVVGILFVLSGFVPFASPAASNSASVASSAPNPGKQENTAGSANGAANPSTSAGAGAQSSTPAAEQPHNLQPNQAAAPTQTQNDTGLQPAERQETEQQPAPPPASSLLDWGATGTRIGLGILLFIAGMMGIALGRGGRRART